MDPHEHSLSGIPLLSSYLAQLDKTKWALPLWKPHTRRREARRSGSSASLPLPNLRSQGLGHSMKVKGPCPRYAAGRTNPLTIIPFWIYRPR